MASLLRKDVVIVVIPNCSVKKQLQAGKTLLLCGEMEGNGILV
jgi:hypothetical protein